MPFRLDTATSTLRTVMDVLARDWASLDPDARPRLEATIAQHAREVATVPASVFANRLVTFLQALWEMRDLLPADAVAALNEGQGVSRNAPAATDAATREELLASIMQVIDPRRYPDPLGLARTLRATIARNQDRLTEDEAEAWREAEEAYRRRADVESFLRSVEETLGHYPVIGRLLEEGKSWQPAPGVVRGLAIPGRERKDAARESGAEQLIPRYANIHFPAAVHLQQQMVPLIVHVAAQFRPGASVPESTARMALRSGDLTLLLHPDDFAVASVIGGRPVEHAGGQMAARVVEVHDGQDCEPVIFFLNPCRPGIKHVSVDVYQFGHNLATLSFETEVVDQLSAGQLAGVALAPAALASPPVAAAPPDVELRVALAADRRTLTYTLHSPGGSEYNFKPAGQVTLNLDPREVLQRYLDRLNQLARTGPSSRPAGDTPRAVAELADIGANLYRALFPRELKNEYRKLRRLYAGKSLLITSDEPWIPWELVRPVEYDDSGHMLYDDPFLCEKFQVARWLAGRGAPGQAVLRTGVMVVATDDLAATREEAEYFGRLYRQQWDFHVGAPLSSVTEVEKSFADGTTQLFHFACHGNFDLQDPNESRLRLADGFLRPSQIVGARQAGLRRAQPVVFLNACHSGEVGFSLTGMGGWAERFLDAGATAFVGSLWEINDRLAARFAAEFYNRLWGLGDQPAAQPLGQAFHGARMAVKQADPANPTWLAYVLYGDPKATVSLGKEHSFVH